MSNNYCRKSGLWQWVPEAYLPNEVRWGKLLPKTRLWGVKHDHWQATTISNTLIRCWDRGHDLELGWFRARDYPAWERDLWHHLEWADAVQEGILPPHDEVWSLVGDNWNSAALENHWTTRNSFLTSKDASCKPYIRVNLVNGFWWQFHQWYFWTATYHRHE